MWGKILGQIIGSLFSKKKQQFVIPQSDTKPAETPTQPIQVATPVVPPPAEPVPAPVIQVAPSKKFTPFGKTRDVAKQRYGEITTENGKLVWKDEAKWMATFKVPAGFENWINSASRRPTGQIYCNKDLHAPLKQALQNILDRGLVAELKTFDGCYQLRMVRGTTDSLSTHTYGLAIDVNAAENGLNVEPKLSPEFVKCWTDAGFSWGGSFRRKDGMHFSFAWE